MADYRARNKRIMGQRFGIPDGGGAVRRAVMCLALAMRATAAVFIFEGDSITAGYGSNANPWPTQAMSLTFFTGGTRYNYAVSGSTIAQMASRYTPNVQSRCQAAGGATLLVFAGTNGFDFTGLAAYWSQAKADGCKVVAITVPSFNIGGTETGRATFNAQIIASSIPDYKVDLAATFGWLITPQYYQADGVHPTDAGAAVIAATVNAALPVPAGTVIRSTARATFR